MDVKGPDFSPKAIQQLSLMDRAELGGVPLRVPLRPPSALPALPGPGPAASGPGAPGPGTKKMRKRRELDALAKRSAPTAPTNGGGVHKRCSGGGGLSSHDQLLSESSADDSAALGFRPKLSGYALSGGYSLASNGYTPGFAVKRRRHGAGRPYGPYPHLGRSCPGPCAAIVRACIALLVLACVIATLTAMWLFIDVREQVFSLRTEIEQGWAVTATSTSTLPITSDSAHAVFTGWFW